MGWTSLPPASNSAHIAGNTRSGRLTRRNGSRAALERIAVFVDGSLLLQEAPPVVHQLDEQGPGHSAVPTTDGRPFPEAPMSCSARTARLLNGTKPYQTTSGPRLLISRWPNSTGARRIFEATQFSISPAPASTSGARKKAERAFVQLAHFSQPKTEEPSPNGAPLMIETRKEIADRSAFSGNETEKETFIAPILGNETRKERSLVALYKRSKLALFS